MNRKPPFIHIVKHEKKAIWRDLYKMQLFYWLLCVAKSSDWSRKITHCQTWLESRFSWNENLQRKQNWTAKSTNLVENTGKVKSVLSSEQPCEPKILDVALKIAGVEKIRSENLWLRSAWRLFDSRFDNERSVSDGGNLCPLWLVILKSVWNSVRDFFKLPYSWPWAAPSYTFLATVPWNGLEHSHRKAR